VSTRPVLSTEADRRRPGRARLSFSVDPAAQHALETEIFGKRILVTDRDD